LQSLEAGIFKYVIPFPGLDHIGQMIVTNTLFVIIILLGISWWSTRRLQLVPRGWQLIMEMTMGWLNGFVTDIMGKKSGPRYLPLIASLFLFVLVGNLIGLIPGCTSPTSNINTNLGLALIVFLMTFFVGIREIGLKAYLKHKMGPVLAIAPVLFLLETVGEFSRPISLTLRLFGNIMGEDVLIMVLNKLAGMLGYLPMIPVMMAILILPIITSLVQAFIFALLPTIYFAGAIGWGDVEEHGEHTPSPNEQQGQQNT
jgi:F-type H+-transporting ATPase subunit a